MKIETLKPLCERCINLAKKLSDKEKADRVNGLTKTLLANPNWPDFKIGIWLGCAETILIENGISSYEIEREFSREIKHEYYRSIGENIPQTIDVMK